MDNGAEGLANISLWFPFFAGSWIVSGILIQNLNLYSLVFVPMMLVFLFSKGNLFTSKDKYRNSLYLQLAFVLVILSAGFIHDQDKRLVIVISFLSFNFSLLFGYYLESSRFVDKTSVVLIKAFLPIIQVVSLSYMGIFSQLNRDFELADIPYSLISLIPGTIFFSRSILIDDGILKKRGFLYERIKMKKGAERQYPGLISALINSGLVIGPAIPAMLLPFSILPQGFFVASLPLLYLAKLATSIQNEEGRKEWRLIKVTSYLAIVSLLSFLSVTLF